MCQNSEKRNKFSLKILRVKTAIQEKSPYKSLKKKKQFESFLFLPHFRGVTGREFFIDVTR